MSQISAEAAREQAHDFAFDGAAVGGGKPGQLIRARFFENKAAVAGLAVLVVLVLAGVAAPLIAKYVVGHGPNELFGATMTNAFGLPKGPNSSFWFGADALGRDEFVRTLYGLRTSLIVAFATAAFAMTIGVVVGLLGGYMRGAVDSVLGRVVDLMLAMPFYIVAIGLAASCSTSKQGCLDGAIQPGMKLMIFIIAIFTWPAIARIIRGNTLSLREKEFVEASRALGTTHRAIMFREILPNLVTPVLVYATLLIPGVVLAEAALSYIGLGMPESTPSLGTMLGQGIPLFPNAWWMTVLPGLVLVLVALSFNLVGDGLRDALDPRSDP